MGPCTKYRFDWTRKTVSGPKKYLRCYSLTFLVGLLLLEVLH